MNQTRKRIIELVTRVTGSAELKRTETALRRIDKATANSNKQLGRMNKQVSGVAVSMRQLVAAATALGGVRIFSGIIDVTTRQADAVQQLNTVLASTEGIAGRTSEQLQNLASSLQSVTTFGDEAIIEAQSLLLTFKEIRGVNFDRAVESVLDLSVAMKQDLKSSVVQVGKALNDPILGLGALSRVGIQFNDEQKELIKTLTNTGRVAEAQVIIFEELESQFGNSAREARKTLGGAIDALKNSFGDLFEATENGTAPLAGSLNEISDIFTNPEFKRGVNDIVDSLLKLSGVGLKTMANFGNIVGYVKDEFLALYGVVDSNDLVRLLEKQASLQERLNETGFSAWLQNTESLQKQLEQVNAEIASIQNKASGNRLFSYISSPESGNAPPATPTGPRTPPLTIDKGATDKLEKSSQLFIDLRKNMEWLDEQAAKAAAELEVSQNALNNQIERSNELFAKFNPEIASYQSSMYDLEDALRLGVISQAEFNAEAKKLEDTLAKSQEGWSLSEEAINLFGDSFDTMLDGVLSGTQSISDGFEDMAKVVIAQLLKIAAYAGVMKLFDVNLGLPAGLADAISGKAKGDVISGGKVVPFANGGLVNSPTLFPMKSGIGLMGEAGPEAILPLKRGAGGNLGVAAAPVNVVVNNMASGVRVNTRETDQGLTLDIVMEQVSSAIRRGGNSIANAMEDSYSLGRGRAVY